MTFMNHLKNFDHVGMVVDDLDRAVSTLYERFGMPCEKQMALEADGIRIAFYPLGSGRMELIEFQKEIHGVDPVVTRPHRGVQHIAFTVEHFDEALAEYRKKGLKIVKGFPRQGAHGRVAFFYPTEGLDLFVEICEAEQPKGPMSANQT